MLHHDVLQNTDGISGRSLWYKRLYVVFRLKSSFVSMFFMRLGSIFALRSDFCETNVLESRYECIKYANNIGELGE